VRQSAKVQFGDYQANGIMAVAKKLGQAPRQLAETVIQHLDLSGIASKVEIAGPGFINIFLDRGWLAEHARNALQHPRLGVVSVEPQTIVV
ncbi:arginine--tRNA ligase, partial [Acinetobacter baumannii]